MLKLVVYKVGLRLQKVNIKNKQATSVSDCSACVVELRLPLVAMVTVACCARSVYRLQLSL
jgi:hypothetical protein